MSDKKLENLSDFVPERALVIVAHPDDIEFGVAGTIARWTSRGSKVTYCMVTDGAAGSNEPDIDVKELAQKRQVEQCAAAEKVGVHDVRFLGYSDGTLQPTLEVRRDLTRLIREVKPDTVVCQDPTTVFVESSYINHPDHRAAGEATVYAVFPSAETRPIFPELLTEGYEPHHVKHLAMTLTLNPNGFVDIAETIEQKIEALLCHKSQVDETVGTMVREWSIENGKEVGVPHAERLRIMHFDDKPDEESA